MGAVEKAIDAATEFIGPYLERSAKGIENATSKDVADIERTVDQALAHLQAIDIADQSSNPDDPYDGSLFGVVYGLLDLIIILGILPLLSPGVAFEQRPRSVLDPSLSVAPHRNECLLSKIMTKLLPIFEHDGSGVQPLLAQRILPDLLSAVSELAFSPETSESSHKRFEIQYGALVRVVPTSRLLPILTSFLQQDVPTWLRRPLGKELAMVPLRTHGVRHTIEFLSLSYLSKNTRMPSESSDLHSSIPIPVEAITQVSRLLVAVPSDMSSTDWFSRLAPQLWFLIDGTEGVELGRAAGQIIAGGLLNRRSTGAPGMIGWELFATPLIQTINPGTSPSISYNNNNDNNSSNNTVDQTLVEDDILIISLKRILVIITSYSHPGLIKRLIGPLLLPLWNLMKFAKSRPSLSALWTQLPRDILMRYIGHACDAKQMDTIAMNIFWDGGPLWTLGSGSHGGVEIRRRKQSNDGHKSIDSIFSRIGKLDELVHLLVSLLVDAHVEDDVAGAIFLLTTKRWLATGRETDNAKTLINEDIDPLTALSNAKLSEAMAKKFKDKFARSPRHIVELSTQLLENFVNKHKSKAAELSDMAKPTRKSLKMISGGTQGSSQSPDTDTEDIVSFALSTLYALFSSPDFNIDLSSELFDPTIPLLNYLSRSHPRVPIASVIMNASNNILNLLTPTRGIADTTQDAFQEYRDNLNIALTDLTSPEPPNRTWALSTLRKIITKPAALPLIDIPSITHMLLSASIADPESYVHTAAVPVVVDLIIRAPNPTLRIIIDAFVDIDELSLRLRKDKDIEQALDFRLRVGEVLHKFVEEDSYWLSDVKVSTRHSSAKILAESTLSLASRRGQRHQTLARRKELAEIERKELADGEAAWGGPIPNLLDPEGESVDQPERDALLKIVDGWGNTGVEEDVRLRGSAMSVFALLVEKRLHLLSQITLDAGLQMVLQILAFETGTSAIILRRASLLVIVGLLKAMVTSLEQGQDSAVGLNGTQASKIESLVRWVKDVDIDPLCRSHAEHTVDGLEVWRMRALYSARDAGLQLDANLGLEGSLRGLQVNPLQGKGTASGLSMVEELE